MASSAVSVQPSGEGDPLLSFGDWIRSKLPTIGLPVGIALLSLALNATKSLPSVPPVVSQHAQAVLHGLHAVLILVLFFLVPQGFKTPNDKYSSAAAAADRFRTAWQLTLLAWVALYVSLVVEASGALPPVNTTSFHLLEDALNCLSTVGLWFCFITVSNPDQRGDPVRWIGLLTCVVILDIMGTLMQSELLMFLAKVGIGSLGGVALAFFVGRLASRLLRPPRWVLGLLYAYAALQFAYGLLDSQSSLHQSIFFLMALLLKILLALFASWLIGTGNLLFYLHYMSELNHDYSGKRGAFLDDMR
jgi:hypothetical protein